MERIAVSIMSFLALTFCFCACENYYDVYLGEAVVEPEGNMIPQKGGTITIPADWVIATKFQFPAYYQAVKYRAYVGNELFCGQTACYLPERKITIPVPENDTYETLDIKVQVALGEDYFGAGFCEDMDFESISFREWQDKYSGKQAALPKESPKKYEQIDNAALVLTVGEQQFNIITYDSWAVKFLRRRVAEGPFEYTGLNCTDSKIGFQAFDLKSCVPAITREFRNDGHASGRIYYDNYWDGEIALYRDECSFASKTLIGNIASDDMERWQRLFEGANLSADRFNDCVKLSLVN